jgi:hypothetical protein
VEFLLYKCCARIGWYRALPGVPAFVNHRGYMYACLRPAFVHGRASGHGAFTGGIALPADGSFYAFPTWFGLLYGSTVHTCARLRSQTSLRTTSHPGSDLRFATTYELSLRMPGQFTWDMPGFVWRVGLCVSHVPTARASNGRRVVD